MPRNRTTTILCAATITAGLLFGAGVANAAEPCAALDAAQDSRDAAFVVDVNADTALAAVRADGAGPIAAFARASATLTAAQDALSDDQAEFATAQAGAKAADEANQRARLAATENGVVDETDADVISTQAEADRIAGIVNDLVRAVEQDQLDVTSAQEAVDELREANDAAVDAIADAEKVAADAQDSVDRAQLVVAGVVCPGDAPPVVVTPTPAPGATVETRTVTPTPTSSVVVNGNITVNPLDDDDSVADVDGTQITVVPQGSASTGA